MGSSVAIAQLPPEVVAQIKSSVSITSLNEVIIQLLKNSLDASAEKLDVEVDYGRGSCIVEDDGLGIAPAEFQPSGGLAKLHRKKPTHFDSRQSSNLYRYVQTCQ